MIGPVVLLAIPVALCAADPHSGITEPALGTPAHVQEYGSPADSLKRVFEGGQSWEEFYEGVDRRRELWIDNWTNARIPDEIVARAAAAGPWRILVITDAGCSDSVNSVPYIARLVEAVPSLELRLTRSAVGKPWMEAHRSPDGRASTPTVLVLDPEYRVRGCWIEQPVGLQSFWLPVVASGTMSENVDEKMEWYARDEGRGTLEELVAVLEGARDGRPVCPGLDTPGDPRESAPASPIERLGWMAGCWEIAEGDQVTEEHWLAPRGGLMLGVGRTVRDGRAVAYEHLRISERDGEVVLVARPSGQAEASFPGVAVHDTVAVFENLLHDFPQRIVYRSRPDSLWARIEGGGETDRRAVDFRFGRVDCAAG